MIALLKVATVLLADALQFVLLSLRPSRSLTTENLSTAPSAGLAIGTAPLTAMNCAR